MVIIHAATEEGSPRALSESGVPPFAAANAVVDLPPLTLFSLSEWYGTPVTLTQEMYDTFSQKVHRRFNYKVGMTLWIPNNQKLLSLVEAHKDKLVEAQVAAIRHYANIRQHFGLKQGQTRVCVHHLFPISLAGHPTHPDNLIALGEDAHHFHAHLDLSVIVKEWQHAYSVSMMAHHVSFSWDRRQQTPGHRIVSLIVLEKVFAVANEKRVSPVAKMTIRLHKQPKDAKSCAIVVIIKNSGQEMGKLMRFHPAEIEELIDGFKTHGRKWTTILRESTVMQANERNIQSLCFKFDELVEKKHPAFEGLDAGISPRVYHNWTKEMERELVRLMKECRNIRNRNHVDWDAVFGKAKLCREAYPDLTKEKMRKQGNSMKTKNPRLLEDKDQKTITSFFLSNMTNQKNDDKRDGKRKRA